MKYMGSKARFAKHILEIVLSDRKDGQWYVEPFCGGCNIIDRVGGNRIANDAHPYLIAMWESLVYGGWIPEMIDAERYTLIKDNVANFPKHVVGWTGFNCSYSGKYFGGFAGEVHTKIGTVRDYQSEAIKNVSRQVKSLSGVVFSNKSYQDMTIPPNSIIYCDPPYRETSEYKVGAFDSDAFWEWCRMQSRNGHRVFVSEYQAPNDFECVWSKDAKSSLSANGRYGGSKDSVERLFVPKWQERARRIADAPRQIGIMETA